MTNDPAQKNLTVGSETVTIRAFRGSDIPEAERIAHALLQDMQEVISRDPSSQLQGILAAVSSLLEIYAETWCRLIALACDRDPEWIAGLPHYPGNNLAMAFWELNQDFFTARILDGIANSRPDGEHRALH